MKTNKVAHITKPILAIGWITVVIIGYYLTHKPVTLTQATAVGQAVLDFVIGIGFTCLAGALGRNFFPLHDLSSLERFVIQAALGVGILALFWLVLGLMGVFSVYVGWLFFLLGLVILRRYLIDWVKELHSLKKLWLDTGFLGRILALGIGIMVFIQLMYALAPPVKWDALMYHLELPRRYLTAGRFLFETSNPYWWFPQITEMIYTWTITLRGLETATVIGCCLSVILLIGILGLISRYVTPTAAWVTAAVMMTGYTFRYMFSWGYVDEVSAIFGLCVLLGILDFIDTKRENWILLIGLFSGLALSVKLINGLVLVILFVVFVTQKQEFGPKWWRYLSVIYLITAGIFLPWILKNIFFDGIPENPFVWVNEWLNIDRLGYSGMSVPAQSFGWHDILLPLSMTWFGVEGGFIGGVKRYYADIGALLIIFSVPGLVDQRSNRKAHIILIWLIVGLLMMVVVGRIDNIFWQTRLYFILLASVALAVGWGWEAMAKLSSGKVRIQRIAGSLVSLVMILALWGDINQLFDANPIGTLLGIKPKDHYLEERLGWHIPATNALHDLPEGSRTLFLWEARGLYAPINSTSDGLIDNWYLARTRYGNDENILKSWKNQGYTHVLVYLDGADYERDHRTALSPQDWLVLDNLLAKLPSPMEFGESYTLYSLIQ